jgi:uncharacterized RDD family membrane protein YckC
MTERNPYAPPEAGVRDVPEPTTEPGILAPRAVRLGGAIVDSIASLVIIAPILFFTGYWENVLSGEVSYVATLAFSGGSFVLFVAMNGYLLARRGQTVGKWLVGTRIVYASDDGLPTLTTTLGARYGVLWVINLIPFVGNVFGLVDVLFIFRADRRCLHDLIAGTKVINVEPPASGG